MKILLSAICLTAALLASPLVVRADTPLASPSEAKAAAPVASPSEARAMMVSLSGPELVPEDGAMSVCDTLCYGMSFIPAPVAHTAITKITFDPDYVSDGTEQRSWAVDDDDTGSIKAYLTGSGDGIIVTYESPYNPGMFRFNPNSSEMFSGLTNLTEIRGMEYCSGELIEDASLMFHACNSLGELDVSGLVSSGCLNIYGMFYGCRELRELSMESWDTSGVEVYNIAFDECYRLERVTLPAGFVCPDALPEPDSVYITGATGKWYEVSGDADVADDGDGADSGGGADSGEGADKPVGYAPADIPVDAGGTYVAVPESSSGEDEEPGDSEDAGESGEDEEPDASVLRLIAQEDASGIYAPFGNIFRRYRIYPAGVAQAYVSAVFEFMSAGEQSRELRLAGNGSYSVELLESCLKAADVMDVDVDGILIITDGGRDISCWSRCAATNYLGTLQM